MADHRNERNQQMRFSLGGISNSAGKLNAVFACLFRSKMGCGLGRTNSGGRSPEGGEP